MDQSRRVSAKTGVILETAVEPQRHKDHGEGRNRGEPFFWMGKGLHPGGETFGGAISFASRCFSVLSVSPWFIVTAVSRVMCSA